MEGDFSFMKSGFNNLQSQEENDKIEQNIVGTIVHFTENALKTAGFYTQHSGRNIITKEDMDKGFKKYLDNSSTKNEKPGSIIHSMYM